MITYSLNCLERMKADLSYPNLFDIFLSHGDRTALEFKVEGQIQKVSFQEMETPVTYVADKLQERLNGCEKGFVALKLDNCPEWPILFWGIMLAGFKPFLIDYRHPVQITQFFLKEAGAVAIIAAEELETGNGAVSLVAEDLIALDKKTLLELAKSTPRDGKHAERIAKYTFGTEVALCTSGTTSTAKVYVYNGEAIGNQILSAEQIIKENDYLLSDREIKNLAFLPMHHIFGFLAVYIWFSFFGKGLVFPDGKAPSALLAACREHGVTHILAVPLLVNNIVTGIQRKLTKQSKFKQNAFKVMCAISRFVQRINPIWGIKLAKKLLKKSVLDNLVGTSLEVIICGGGHVLPNTLNVINSIGYYTVCGFGMTEVGISSLNLSRSLDSRLSGCVGIPMSCLEYRVIPLDDAKPNVGALQIKGATIHSGRMVDGQQLPPTLTEDGWFETGDIGRLDNGALYIEGRLKEVIINESGENVYPDELEDTFTGLNGITQFTVMGIPKSADSKYEDIALIMETSKDVNDEAFTQELMKDIMARNATLPVFKKVSAVLITSEPLPLSNGIKVKRAEIKKQIVNGATHYVKLK